MNKNIEVNEESFIDLVKNIREIRTCLLGDEYHPDGLVHQVKQNTDCINKVKRKQMGFFAIIGGAWTAFTIGISLLISHMKN